PRGAAFPRRSYRRILTVEQPELVVDGRIAAPRLTGGLEERLADHREELRRMLGRIGIEPGVLSALYRVAKALVGVVESRLPGAAVHAGVKRRHAVRCAVQHVELVGELVDHNYVERLVDSDVP